MERKMSSLAVMQPYLFPYIGYFQLIAAVDEFVVLDNVQYINRGWINRNRILENGVARLFTFSVQKDAREKNINQRYFSHQLAQEREKFLRSIEGAYRKAPYFSDAFPLIAQSLPVGEEDVAKELVNSLRKVCVYLGISTPFFLASDILDKQERKGQEYILAIARAQKAQRYVNLSGGMELYSPATFAACGIELKFIKNREISYRQFLPEMVSNLSIIDVLMFNSREETRRLLERYDLL